MPALLEWYSKEDGVLLIRLEAPLNWDEYHNMVDALDAEAANRTERFDVINITKAAPPKGNPIPHFQRLERVVDKHSHLGLYITVNPAHSNVIVRTLTSLFNMRGMKLSKTEFAPTIEDAYERIKEHRQRVMPTT